MKRLTFALLVFLISFSLTRLFIKPQLMASFVPPASSSAPTGSTGGSSR